MGNLTGLYDAATVIDDGGSFGTIPPGWYRAFVSGAEIKTAKSGGSYVSARLDIIGPTHAGRVVWASFTIANPSDKAVEIGRAQLKSLHVAGGRATISDTRDLVGLVVEVKIAVDDRDPNYEPRNSAKAFRPVKGAAPGIPAVAQSTPTGARPPAVAQATPTADPPYDPNEIPF